MMRISLDSPALIAVRSWLAGLAAPQAQRRDRFGRRQASRLHVGGEQLEPRMMLDAGMRAMLPDLAAASDTGVSNSDDLTSDRTPALTGSVRGAATQVRVFINGAPVADVPVTDGTWTYEVPATAALAAGTHRVRVRAVGTSGGAGGSTGVLGPISRPLSITIVTETPTAPTVMLDSASNSGVKRDGETVVNEPMLRGRAARGQFVSVSIDGVLAGRVRANAPSGVWSLKAPRLANGVHDVTAVAENRAGIQSAATSFQLTINGERTVMLDGSDGNTFELTAGHLLGQGSQGFIVTQVLSGTLQKWVASKDAWVTVPTKPWATDLASLQRTFAIRKIGPGDVVRWTPARGDVGTGPAFAICPSDTAGGPTAPTPAPGTVPGKLVNAQIDLIEDPNRQMVISWSDPIDGCGCPGARYSMEVNRPDGRTLVYSVPRTVHGIPIVEGGLVERAKVWGATNTGAGVASTLLGRDALRGPAGLELRLSGGVAGVPENQPVGTVVGTLTALSGGDGGAGGRDGLFTYSLVAGEGATHNAHFAIAGNQLTIVQPLDHESTRGQVSLRVQVRDRFGRTAETVLPMAVSDVAEMRGRFLLNTPISGASVTVIDSLTKTPLAATVTESGGFFDVNVPDNGPFMVVARPVVNGVAEVWGRSFERAPASRYLAINAPTSVGMAYHMLHPGVTVAAAEAAAKRLLGIPEHLDAGRFGNSTPISGFRHGRFLSQARAGSQGQPGFMQALVTSASGTPNSSVAAKTLQDLAAEIDKEQETVRFWIENNEPFDGPTLEDLANGYAAWDEAQDSVNDDLESSLSSVTAQSAEASAATAEEAALTELLSGFGGFVAESAAAAAIGIGVEALFSALGITSDPNAEVMDELQEIAKQLDGIDNKLDQLENYISTAFAQSDYLSALNTLASAIAGIQTAWDGTDGVGGYRTVIQQFANSANSGPSVDQATAAEAIAAIGDILPGGNNYQSITTLGQFQQLIVNSQLGDSLVSGPSLIEAFRNLVSPLADGSSQYRYASNHSINQMYAQFNQFKALQLQAAQVIAFLMRAGTKGDGSDLNFDQAQTVIKNTSDQIQHQRSMLPFTMPDDQVILDTSSGLVLVSEIFPAAAMSQLDLSMREGDWPYIFSSPNNQLVSYPWPEQTLPRLTYDLGDLSVEANDSLFLPSQGLLYTFLDPTQQTWSLSGVGGENVTQNSVNPAPSTPYILNLLDHYGLGRLGAQDGSWAGAYLRSNYGTSGNLHPTWQSGAVSSSPIDVAVTGYYTPFNVIDLGSGSAWPYQDRFDIDFNTSGAIYDPSNSDFFSLITPDYRGIHGDSGTLPYVLMANASPSGQPLHPDLQIASYGAEELFAFPNTVNLRDVARVPVLSGTGQPNGGLHSATNRAFFGAGSVQGAAVAFQGTQLVALAAENPQYGPNGQADGLFGVLGLLGGSLNTIEDFIGAYYGDESPGQYVEGPNGIDTDMDTSFGLTGSPSQPGTTLINSAWDLTPHLYWTSSDPSIADVSNAPGQIGQIIRKGGSSAGTVTFTGSRTELNRAGSVGEPVTVTATYTFDATPPAVLQSIYLTPRFQKVSFFSNLQLYAYGGMTDGTSSRLDGSNLTWQSSDPASVNVTGGLVQVQVIGTPPTNSVTITATDPATNISTQVVLNVG